MAAKRLFLILLISTFSFGCSGPQKSWPEKMQELSKALLDAFPFLYTQLEFEDPKNKDIVRDKIKLLKKSVHGFPEDQGKLLIGAEPLITELPKKLSGHLDEALELYDNKKYDEARSNVVQAIQQCGACHTSHRVGPTMDKINLEVLNTYANIQGKVEVLMAIRQYEGALNIIEAYMKGRKYNISYDRAEPLLKYHAILSARALGDYKRSRTLFHAYSKSNPKYRGRLLVWQRTLRKWEKAKGDDMIKYVSTNFKKPDSPSAFIGNLAVTENLHHSLVANKSKATLRDNYNSLANAYGNMKLEAFNIFPLLYFKACNELKGEVGGDCQFK
jgi:cytochrome c556